ncbi:MAG: glycosyltransferase [Anaerolineae bacterium]|nr:glycosyltransferase [Anaerolineae bacterium]
MSEIIQEELGQTIDEHLRTDNELRQDGLGSGNTPPCEAHRAALLGNAPFASVIIATRNRATQLATTLDSVLAQIYPQFEVIVVDNAPATDETWEMIRTRYGHLSHVRYIREDRPGLASAHNAGVVHSRGSILAFADDDLRLDERWLFYLASAMRSTDKVGCVTGLIMPAELETQAQMWLEQYSNFSKGLTTQVFDMAEHRQDNPLYPYAAGIFGSGANMAFSREAVESIGGFDTAMGVGTSARGGDDLVAFLDVILAGYRLIYEPAAIVWHQHRREYEALRRQVFGYGVGLSAYLTRACVRHPRHAINMLIKLPQGIRHMVSPNSTKNVGKPTDFPRELNRLERLGLLCGPFAYLRSRWENRAWGNLDAYKATETPDGNI